MNKKEQHSLVLRIGLISLSDVKTYWLSRLNEIAYCFASLDLSISLAEDWNTNSTLKQKVFKYLRIIATEAKSIDLTMTAIYAERFASELDNLNVTKASENAAHLRERFDDEIEPLKLFWVKADRLKGYNNPSLAGEEFRQKFPKKGNIELIEAGNCLSLDRYTACVFHLMRAFEVVLTCLESKLGIPKPSADADKTWGRTLNRIRDKISENDKNAPANWPQWSQEKGFYDQGYALLQAMKSAFRDDTMHVESTYDEQSALDVFQVTTVALRHFSTKLSE